MRIKTNFEKQALEATRMHMALLHNIHQAMPKLAKEGVKVTIGTGAMCDDIIFEKADQGVDTP